MAVEDKDVADFVSTLLHSGTVAHFMHLGTDGLGVHLATGDYYTAIIYEKCGLPVELFPPMFFLARLPGLIAHVGEQRGNNRLIHPSSSYTGLQPRRFLRLDER